MSLKIDFKTLNLQDALDLAILIEEEARERYLEFAAGVGSRYDGDAGDFFKKMAENEAKHAREISEKRKKLFKDAPRRVEPLLIWDVEAPESGKARTYMSARQAMTLALEAETKAWGFFDEALKQVQNAEVKALFTELRGEEKQHQEAVKAQLAKLPKSDGPDLEEDDIDEPPAL